MGNYIDIARAAITLARAADDVARATSATTLIDNLGTAQTLAYLDYHCLSPLCFEQYARLPATQQDTGFADDLKRDTVHHVALERTQLQAMTAVHEALEQRGIPYAFFKGSAARLCLYDQPHQRPAADIDLLVLPTDRDSAIKALMDAGLPPQPLPENLTHEVTLMHGHTEIDLHWHILRPGRLPATLTEQLLSTRISREGFWCLAPHANLLVQLVHPAFAKYVNSPWAKHIRQVDIARTLEGGHVEWQTVLDDLIRLRAKTAAWCTLLWFRATTNSQIPDFVMRALEPSAPKRWYLRLWILRGLTHRHFQRRHLMRFGLSLFLQDNLADAVAAVRAFRADRTDIAKDAALASQLGQKSQPDIDRKSHQA